MNNLCFRLAISGIRKNKSTFLPFAITCTTMTMMYYMLQAMEDNIQAGSFRGAAYVKVFLSFGLWVAAIMSVIILLYTNGFLMKHRAKEFGIYNVLGLEKKHIRRVLLWEILSIGVISTVVGLGIGMLLGRLLFLLLLYILRAPIGVPYRVDLPGAGVTALFFFGIYLVLVLMNSIRIAFFKPVDMLRENRAGEREPKLKLVTTILGLVCLAAGYVTAQIVESAMTAVSLFFVAVILVIVGTYLLFMSGSIALLKLLKKNKHYYYHKTHFITVSGMMYRMKQNAMGLATICILSTMVLVTMSTTVALYLGIGDQVRTVSPYDVMLFAAIEDSAQIDGLDSLRRNSDELLEDYQVVKREEYQYCSFNVTGEVTENGILNWDRQSRAVTDIYGYCMEDARALSAGDTVLAEAANPAAGEVYLCCINDDVTDVLTTYLQNHGYRVTAFRHLPRNLGEQYVRAYQVEPVVVLASDVDALLELAKALPRTMNSGDYMYPTVYFNDVFNLEGTRADMVAYSYGVTDAVSGWMDPSMGYGYSCYYLNYEDMYATDGTLLYIGCFLGVLFLLATVLIIYYKQISEGYDDRKRFLIMENVGMSRQEVKKVIRNQIVTVFVLPILVACMHIVFAFHMIELILHALQLTNVGLFIGCTIGTVVVFVIIDVIVYLLTARAYYRIVNTVDAKA